VVLNGLAASPGGLQGPDADDELDVALNDGDARVDIVHGCSMGVGVDGRQPIEQCLVGACRGVRCRRLRLARAWGWRGCVSAWQSSTAGWKPVRCQTVDSPSARYSLGTPVSIRVLIADDQQLVRSGFMVLLDAEPDIEVVGEAADGVMAMAEARRLRPDIVLMDIRMPRVDGIAATRSITNTLPGTRVIILTTYDLDEYVFDALRAGAYGFLLKDVRTAELADAVRTVTDGRALLAPTVTLRMISQFARSPGPAQRDRLLAVLTPREGEVLELVGHGLSNTEIAARLVTSQTTAKTHVARILLKLGLRDRVQAAVLAYERGSS
jgi:DNA-binding NarL/FixJ family response regulator